MSLEQKIKDMLADKKTVAVSEQVTLPLSNTGSGDKTPPAQGSSEQPQVQELDKDISGKSAAAPISQEAPPTMVGDATTVTTQAQDDAKKTVKEGEEKADLKADVEAIFAGQEGLAEGFVEKATAVFEAAVVARTNAEVVKAVEKLNEQHEAAVEALKAKLAEDVDQYMTYVVENWMKENKVAVDAGLRTEVAESFIAGLKDLFVENYIEVPEDKVDVLESLSTDLDATKSRLNEEIEKSIALADKIVELEKTAVLEAAFKGLAVTDAERLVKLVEGVEFDSKDLFAEKVAVIKETHFKAAPKKSAEVILAEGAGEGNSEIAMSESVQRYVNALNRNSKF